MSPLRARIASIVVIAVVAVPATAHSVHKRREEKRSLRDIEALTAAIEPIAISAGGVRRVSMNGAPLLFRTETRRGSLEDVMASIARECASGDHDLSLGAPPSVGEGQSRDIRLERVFTQEAASSDVRASLCIFAPDTPDDDAKAGTPSEPVHRVRYNLARQREDGTTSVTTVVNLSSTPLAEIFPAEGDSPGSDLADVARPELSKRTLTAIVGNNEHAVRVYESQQATEAAVTSYDTAMTKLGFATTAATSDARMYRRDGKSYVASFRATTEGCSIAIAPFGHSARAQGKPAFH
jgi:hypothetical protein